MADLVREVLIDASPSTIYRLLTVSEEHVRWMGTEAEIDPRPGGAYRVLVAGQFEASGEVLAAVPDEKLAYTFGWHEEGNPIRPGSTTVEITLHPEGDKTRVRLAHTGLPDEAAVAEHVHGWDHYLGRLDVVALGGEAGPDTPPDAG